MSFWSYLTDGYKARRTKDKTTKVVMGEAEGTSLGSGSSRMTDFGTYMEAVTIPNVYSAISVIGYAAANLPMDVVDVSTGQVIDLKTVAPDLHKLLDQPNSMSNNFHYREMQAYDLLLTGNNIGAKDEYFLNKPTALYRLRPDRVKVGLKNVAGSAQLEYALYNSSSNLSTPDATYAQDEIIHWKTANPRDPIWGLGVVEAGEVAFSANRSLNEMIRAYFERGAVLDGVILLPQEELTEDEYTRLITRWRSMRQRGKAAVKTGVLTGGATWKSVQEPLGSFPVVELKQMSRNEVLELFGVPPAKLGDFKGANWRNAQEADAFFYKETVGPLVRRTEQGWSSIVMMWNENWRVQFRLPDLASDFAQRATAAMQLAQANSFERNEIRETTGFPRFEHSDPRGREIVNIKAPLGQPVEVGGDQTEAEATSAAPADTLAEGDTQTGSISGNRR